MYVTLYEAVHVPLPTPFGTFEAWAFEQPTGHVYVALVAGEVRGRHDVLTRPHSECLTGDALASLRCDCGVQLRLALRTIAAEEQGVLIYATGHEGRAVGLVNKLRSYVVQDRGADTVDANVRLGLPVDARDYRDTAAVLEALGVRSVRLLTNNPAKVSGLRHAGVDISEVVPLATAPHSRNQSYLRTKERRLGHISPAGHALQGVDGDAMLPVDATGLLGPVRPLEHRPYVVLKFAQTLDGRIATATGDARWISGDAERRVSHALRAACDGVLVGIGTALRDNPQLTVRMVPGASPRRIVLDSTLRLPMTAQLLGSDASTTVITTSRSPAERRAALADRGIRVEVVDAGPDGVDLADALAVLRETGTTSLLVEGGAKVITSMLAARVVDRLIVGLAPTIIGDGTQAVGDLKVTRVADGIRLVNRSIHPLDDDLLLSFDLER